MINRSRCITLVLLDTSSTKHDHRWIRTLWTCSCVCRIGAADIEVPILCSLFKLKLTIN